MAETTEEEKNTKFTSRKFIVWLIATIIFGGLVAFGFITKSEELLKTFIPYWAYISMLYIGGNVAQDFALGLKGKTND